MNPSWPRLVRDPVFRIQKAEPDNDINVLVSKRVDLEYFIPHIEVTKPKEHRGEAAKLTGSL